MDGAGIWNWVMTCMYKEYENWKNGKEAMTTAKNEVFIGL